MALQLTTALLVLGALLAGCNGKKDGTTTAPTGASAPVVAQDIDHGKCQLSSVAANTCVRKTTPQGGRLVCHVFVGMAKNNKPYVMPYNLSVKGGVIGDTTVIVWHLVDAGLRFETGLGPKAWKKPTAISDGQPTDDADGDDAPAPATSRRFRVKMDTSVPAPAADPNTYAIKFRDRNGDGHTCDPIIINEPSN